MAKNKNLLNKLIDEVDKTLSNEIPNYETKKKKVVDTIKGKKTETEKIEKEENKPVEESIIKKKKFCSNCGEEVDEEDKYCDSCGKEIKKKKSTSKANNQDEKIKSKKCPNCGASIKAFQTSCNYCRAEISNIKASNSLEEFSKGLEKIKSKSMPKFEAKESLLKKVIGKDFNNEDEKEEFENNFIEQKNEEIANYILNFPIPNSNEDLTEFMILVTSNIDLKKESDDVVQKAWKSKMNQIYEKARLSINNESDLKKIRDLFEKKNNDIKTKKIINTFKISAGIIGWFSLLGLLVNPLLTVISCLFIAGIMLTIFSYLINKNVLPNNMKLKNKTSKILSYLCFSAAILIALISWVLSNPFVSIGIILLLFSIILFVYFILIEKNKIKNKYNISKKLVYILCGILAGISLILFIVNGVNNSDFDDYYEPDYEEYIEENIKDTTTEDEKEKDSEEAVTNENEKEETSSSDGEENENVVIMLVLAEEYIGKNYKEIESEMKDLGYTNIKLEKKKTNEEKNKDKTIKEFSINGKSDYERGTRFKKNDEVKIVYWELEKKESVSYSTNDYDTAKKGTTGIYSYIKEGKYYDIYYIIDFDDGYVYYFLEGEGNDWCDKLKIKSGDLNSTLLFTYHEGNDTWDEALYFKYKNQPSIVILEDGNHIQWEFSPTNLEKALKLRDNKKITSR